MIIKFSSIPGHTCPFIKYHDLPVQCGSIYCVDHCVHHLSIVFDKTYVLTCNYDEVVIPAIL